jgi:hypothetical protein
MSVVYFSFCFAVVKFSRRQEKNFSYDFMRVITRSLSNNVPDCTCQHELDLMGQGILLRFLIELSTPIDARNELWYLIN